jgi:hypothetical protein
VTIPEFRAIGDEVGKLNGEALAGRLTTEEALKRSQHFTQRQMLLWRYP